MCLWICQVNKGFLKKESSELSKIIVTSACCESLHSMSPILMPWISLYPSKWHCPRLQCIEWKHRGRAGSPVSCHHSSWTTQKTTLCFGYNCLQCTAVYLCKKKLKDIPKLKYRNIFSIKGHSVLLKTFSKSTTSRRPGICFVSVYLMLYMNLIFSQ